MRHNPVVNIIKSSNILKDKMLQNFTDGMSAGVVNNAWLPNEQQPEQIPALEDTTVSYSTLKN